MIINGLGVSAGIAIGRAYVIKKQQAFMTGTLLVNDADVLAEIEKFNNAVTASVSEIEAIINNYDPANGYEGLDILEAHIELISDPQIKDDVTEKINIDKKNANDALIEVIANAVELFKSMDDEYMAGRAADVQDIGNRLLKNLNAKPATNQTEYAAGTIIIAEDLSPSDTITMDISKIAGFATQVGGATSHAAIIAKSRGIPAVLGCGDAVNDIKHDSLLILDGQNGLILVEPDEATIDRYKARQVEWLKKASLLNAIKNTTATTTDGTIIHLVANIANAADMTAALEFGAEGAGLLRTELLFMGRDYFPTEDEQFEFYKAVALQAKDKPVTARTLDIGGDKNLPYFNLPAEQNPFLGYRAIRISLDRTDVFITQLKAILRASVFGNLRIMFPMIANIQEIRAAKEVLNQAKTALTADNIAFKDVKVGIMIEIPSAAITADLLAKEVDFFSIGTNDLCQYTLAVDRMNEKIGTLYDPYNPGVLRLIQYVIEQGYKHNIEVGMCGELASDPKATLLLMGMGLTEFSMNAVSIPQIKNIIINSDKSAAKQIHQTVMQMDSSADIRAYLQEIDKW